MKGYTMSDDLVKRLRSCLESEYTYDPDKDEAADYIEALEAALAKADALAFRFSSMIATMEECEDHAFNDDKISLDAYRATRKKLQGKEVHPD